MRRRTGRSHRPVVRGVALAGICLAAAGGLSGCSMMGNRDTGQTTMAESPLAADSPGAESSRYPMAGGADVKDISCTADDKGNWTFRATIKNPTHRRSHYTVSVSVASRGTGAVFGNSSQTFAVGPHRNMKITLDSVANSAGAPPDSVACGNLVTVVRDS